jgi:hypothetical protein
LVTVSLSKLIHAPIEDVFGFFDDQAKTMEFNAHAVDLEVMDVQPDGRRTFDIVMSSDAMDWMQTVEQVVRERPTRLVTRGGSWTTDRRHWVLTFTVDRRFTTEAHGTRVDVTIDTHLDRPYLRPLQAIRNWLHQGATQTEFEHQLVFMARRIEGMAARDTRP